jgi:outer membrane protein OmpA-like peptidoglycan-associated protein
VFFRPGSAVPDPSQAAAIQSLAPALVKAKRIVVTGCTDQTGTRATNQRLAEQRAAGLRDLLLRLGVRKEQIEFRIDLSGNGNLPGTGITDRIPEDVNARARRGDIAVA